MDKDFARIVESLTPKLDALLAAKAYRYGSIPRDIPTAGVYLFSDGPKHLYVGRSPSAHR